MDKLNKNMFGLGVVLAVAVLGGGAWKLVLEPGTSLQKKASQIKRHEKDLSAYLKTARPKRGEGQILGTKKYAAKLQKSEEEMKESFKDAADLFKARCDKFQLFWELPKGETPSFTDIPPELADSGEFNAAYRDGNNNLREKYWEKFPAPVVEDPEGAAAEEEDRESKAPVIEMVKSEEISANMPRAMKQYLVTEAVFDVCNQLDIAGLQKIEFPQERAKTASRRSSASRKADEAAEEAGGKVEYGKVEAMVELHMQYGKLQSFLSTLYQSERVPFIEPKSIEFGKLPSSLEGFAKYVRQETFKSQALADAAQAAGQPSAEEPPVKVIMRLVAIDWKGVEVAGEDSGEQETE